MKSIDHGRWKERGKRRWTNLFTTTSCSWRLNRRLPTSLRTEQKLRREIWSHPEWVTWVERARFKWNDLERMFRGCFVGFLFLVSLALHLAQPVWKMWENSIRRKMKPPQPELLLKDATQFVCIFSVILVDVISHPDESNKKEYRVWEEKKNAPHNMKCM